VLAPLAVLAMLRGVILPEEAYLTERFGDEYARYRRAVRRWL
jgi:protein-S-isoprenylcysteine O-methyltransferase Ste14